MKKYIAIVLCFLCASAYSAEFSDWYELAETDDGQIKVIVNTKSIKQDGAYRKVWVMHNYKKPGVFQKKPFRSLKALEHYDCHNDKVKTLSEALYSKNDGKGKVVASYNITSSEFASIIPGTIGEITKNFVCSVPEGVRMGNGEPSYDQLVELLSSGKLSKEDEKIILDHIRERRKP